MRQPAISLRYLGSSWATGELEFRSAHAVCHSFPSEVLKIALTATTSHPGSGRRSRHRLHMGTAPSLSAQRHEIRMNVARRKRVEKNIARPTHCLRTSATREASSALKVTPVPFSACNRINSLNDLRSFPPPSFRRGVSSTPSLGNTTEFRGVDFVRLFTREGLISPSERSQSSELSEREDSVKFSLKDMAVWAVRRTGQLSEAGMEKSSV